MRLVPDTQFNLQLGATSDWTIVGLVLLLGLGLYAGLYARQLLSHPKSLSVLDLKIRRRGNVLTAIFIALAIVVSGGGYWQLSRMSQEDTEDFFEKQRSVATVKAEQLDTWLREKQLDAKQIRESLALADLTDLVSGAGRLDEIRRYLRALQLTSAERTGVNIHAPDGALIVGVGETIGQKVSLPQILAAASTADTPQIVDAPDLDKHPSSFRVHVVIPLGANESHRPAIAALVLTLDPRQGIFRKIQEWPTDSRSSEALIARRVGDEVVYLNTLRHRDPASPWLRVPLTEINVPAVRAVLHSDGVHEGIDYRGVAVLAGYRHLEAAPWYLVAKTDVDEGTAANRRQVVLVASILGLVLTTSALFFAYLWREQQSLYVDYQNRQLEERAALARHYERLILSSRDLFFLLDPAGNVIEFNEAAVAAYGYSADEMRRLNVRDLRTKESNETFLRDWQASGLPAGVLFETEHRRKDGTSFPVEVSSRVIDIDGKPYRQSSVRIISERKRLEESLLRTTRVLTSLQMAKGALLKAQSEGELFQTMCDIIVSVGGFRMANVGMAEQDEEKTVRFVAVSGTNDGYLEKARITWGDGVSGSGPTGTAIRSGEIQVNQNFQTNERMAPWREAARERGFQASISLPVREADRVFGTLTIYAAQPDAFNVDEVNLLGALADDISYGVSALRTRKKAAVAAAQVRDSMEKTIGVLAEAVEVRDPYTAGHQSRVAQLARAIALELHLPAETIQGIYLGGLIHDVGKISIPAEILSKPGKLTKIEYDLIKQHPRVGADIIKPVSFPWPVADMIAQHHERIDGSGYPDGLKGDAIRIESRILAVADVMEAMMSHRPYRPGLGIERALQELDRGRGTSYDTQRSMPARDCSRAADSSSPKGSRRAARIEVGRQFRRSRPQSGVDAPVACALAQRRLAATSSLRILASGTIFSATASKSAMERSAAGSPDLRR